MNSRGYVSSRSINGNRVAQHIQNLVIRDYCNNHGMHYLLSATEYVMKDCYMVLDEQSRITNQLDAIVLFSMFQLPSDLMRRNEIIIKFIDNNTDIHFAVERTSVKSKEEISKLNDIFLVENISQAASL